MRRIDVIGLLIVTAIGFSVTVARWSSARITAAPADERALLLQTDREFDQATADRGVEGWVRYFAENGLMFPDQEGIVSGKAAVGRAMGPAFAQAGFSLRWKPTGADVSRAGDLGYTYGTYVAKRTDAQGKPVTRYGKYVTIWKKQRDGTWKIALDIGNTSPPPADAPSSSVKLSLRPCQLPNVDGEARCGNYEVFENRAAKAGRKISLNIVVLPALRATPAADPVFWLHGGPGAAATQMTGAAKNGFLEGLRKDHGLVFVDQRGTGRSNGLTCDIIDDPADLQRFFGELFPPDKMRSCREKLERVADLTLYTTPVAMDDLDEVREALGYDKINIVAGSYGTIAAQVYMRQHPEHLRAVFLVGVATPGIKQPLPFAKGAQEALDRLFEDCAADEGCRRAFPNLPKEFAAVLARFDKGPVEAELINPSTKQKQSVKISRSNFVERVRLSLYTTPFGRFVPLVIHKAFENDYLPFEAMAIRSNLGNLFARGMYFTVTCSESVPFITEQDIIRETTGTFVGDGRVRSHIEACKEWPSGNIPRSYIDPVKSDVPVLMISGELDASTPVWLGENAVEHLRNGRQVKIRYYGHQLDNPCVWHILWEFIEKGSAKGIDTTCTDKIRRPPFASELPKQFSL